MASTAWTVAVPMTPITPWAPSSRTVNPDSSRAVPRSPVAFPRRSNSCAGTARHRPGRSCRSSGTARWRSGCGRWPGTAPITPVATNVASCSLSPDLPGKHCQGSRRSGPADAVQRGILPRQVATLTYIDIATKYLPSRADWRISVDFYDVIELPENKVGLLVGDVQGHAVEAAAAMGQIRVAFRAYATNQSDPGVVLGETNRLLTETGEIVFATCGYLVVDRESGVMQAAWAGQPPVVLAAKGEYRLWAPETGPPLGVVPDTEYTVTTSVLAPGGTLLLCSDGLV